MKTAVETLEPTRVKLTVDVPFEELAPSIEHAYQHIAKDISIPGFRKGKVPPRIIDQRIGFPAVLEHAVNEAMPGLYRDAVTENDIKVMGQPDIELTAIPADKTGDLSFTAEVDVRPDFEVPELDGFEIEVPSLEVSEEEVDGRIEVLRQRFGTLQGVDRAAADGDFLVLDLTAVVNGDEVDSASGISYQIGSGTMLDGLDEAVIGLSAGDTKAFSTSLAGGEHEGEEAEVTVTVTQVKEQELPELDDDFAQLASEFDTLAELRDDLRSQAAQGKVNGQAVLAQNTLLEKLLEQLDFPLPDGVVQLEVNRHLEQENRTEDDEHRAEAEEEVRQGLRRQLVLDTLVERFEVGVTQEELVNFLVRMAQQYRVDPNEFIQNADQTGQIPVFVGELARNKAAALALRKVSVKDTDGNDVDLTPFIGSDEMDALRAQADEAARAQAEGDDSEGDDSEDAPEADAEETPTQG